MGDRTTMSVLVYDVPPHLALPVIRVLGQYFGDADATAHELETAVQTRQVVSAYEVPVGTGDFLVKELDELRLNGWDAGDPLADGTAAAAGEFGWIVWDDPAITSVGPTLGQLRAYRPGRGPFTADCDAFGTPCIAPDTLRHVLADAPSLANAREQLDQAIGWPWTTPLRQLREQHGPVAA